MIGKELFSVAETAKKLGIPQWVVWELIAARELKDVTRKRGKYLVPRYEIERLLNIMRG